MAHDRRISWVRRWFTLSMMALVLAALCGCGGSSQKVLYAVGPGSPSVTIFTVSSSGELAVTASGVSTGSAPVAIGIDPLLHFAYVVDSAGGIQPGGVSQYTLNAGSGALTPVVAPLALTAVNPVAIAIDHNTTFAFVANNGSNSISAYAIDSTTGALTEVRQRSSCISTDLVCPFLIAVAPSGMVISGSSLFVSTQGGAACPPPNASINCTLWVYSFDSTGKLADSSAAQGPASVRALALDPAGKFLFAADAAANTVAAFTVSSSGQLTAVGGPVATGTTPMSVCLHPSGKFLYTANQGSNDVSAFSIDGSGALTPLSGSPVAAGASPSSVTTDTSGSFLFVANRDSNNISAFSIDSSGALKAVSGSPFASVAINPVALASIN